jgi:hypothetical protein
MEPSSWARQVAWFVLIGFLVAGAILAGLHHARGHSIAAASQRTPQPQQAVAAIANQPSPPEQPQAGTDEATLFASMAESEVSQLHEGTTLAQWMDRRGKRERWENTKPELLVGGPDEECSSLRRTDALPSGATVVRALYFYPRPRSASIEPGFGTRDRFRRGCLLLQGILLGLVWFLPLR